MCISSWIPMCFPWWCPESSIFIKNKTVDYTQQILGGNKIEALNYEKHDYI